MSIQRNAFVKPGRGVALVVVFFVLAAIVTMIMALLQVTSINAKFVDNTRDRCQALLLAQAGINHAVAELNLGHAIGSNSHDVGCPNVDWGMQQNYTVTTVTNADGSLTITSIGTYKYVQYGTTNYDRLVRRELVAVAQRPNISGGFPAGAFGKAGVTLTGNATTDSFNSNLGTTYAQQVAAAGGLAIYDATIGAGGNVGSNQAVSGVGNMIVHGNATPGPGSSVSLTGGATVTGSTTAAASIYIAPDYVYAVPSSGVTQTRYSGNSDQTFGPGTIEFASKLQQTGGTITFAAGVTNVYLDDDFKQSGQGIIVLATGAVVNIYQSQSGIFDMAGKGLTNGNNVCNTFNVVSASTGAVNITGQGDIYATVYAPYADAKVAGQGSLYGAVIGNTVKLDGLGEFHYDTNAKSPGIVSKLVIVSIWEKDL